MEVSQPRTGLLCGAQVSPPSLLRRIWPANPTIHPLLGSLKYTELSDHVAADVRTGSHFFPPSTVRRMVPAQPTAQPRLASRKKMLSIVWVVPEACGAQVLPPSGEWRIRP